MRILQVGKYLPPVPGGMETAVYELACGLADIADFKVSCLVTNTKNKTIHETLNGNVNVVRVASFGTLASTPLSPLFKHEASKIESDLLHFHLPNPLATSAFSNPQKPYVVTYHCDIVKYQTLLKFYRPFLNHFLSQSEKIIVSSESLIESSSVLRNFKNKCMVIPLAVDPKHLEPNTQRRAIEKSLKEQFGERIILFVGRLVAYKGLNDLIEAMKVIDGNLIIVGTGPEENKLKTLVQRLGLARKVHFAGFISQEDLGAYYHASRIVALTSLNESEAFGMCLVEGLSCGKPLLTTKLGTGVSSVNVDGKTGFSVDVGNRKQIAEKISRLLNDSSLYNQFSENALTHFKNNFHRDAMTRAHEKLYREILQK